MPTSIKSATQPAPLRLVAFDAGPPVGALMQLHILEGILRQMGEPDSSGDLYAYEHFDLMCGTGLGGQVLDKAHIHPLSDAFPHID
jgi:hypothetical protein